MFSATAADAPGVAELITRENLFFAVIGILLSMPLLERSVSFHSEHDVSPDTPPTRIVVWRDGGIALILLTICSMYVVSGTYNPFIYFRF